MTNFKLDSSTDHPGEEIKSLLSMRRIKMIDIARKQGISYTTLTKTVAGAISKDAEGKVRKYNSKAAKIAIAAALGLDESIVWGPESKSRLNEIIVSEIQAGLIDQQRKGNSEVATWIKRKTLRSWSLKRFFINLIELGR